MPRFIPLTALLLLATGCSRDRNTTATPLVAVNAGADSLQNDSIARARQDSVNRAQPGYVIDSILPVEEMLRRFKARVGGATVATLQHASPSRDALVTRFMTAVAAADSSALRDMALNAREFVDLVYPEGPNTKPPYKEDPALVWRTIQNPSQSGFIRLIRRQGEIPTKLVDYRCTGATEKQGKNTLISGCVLRLIDRKGETTSHRYFGSIIERDGTYKIVSYHNEF
jgi:hypothetical protein